MSFSSSGRVNIIQSSGQVCCDIATRCSSAKGTKDGTRDKAIEAKRILEVMRIIQTTSPFTKILPPSDVDCALKVCGVERMMKRVPTAFIIHPSGEHDLTLSLLPVRVITKNTISKANLHNSDQDYRNIHGPNLPRNPFARRSKSLLDIPHVPDLEAICLHLHHLHLHSPSLHQRLDYIRLLLLLRKAEWSESLEVSLMNFRPFVDQQVDKVEMPPLRSLV
mmetsp:Transcript_47824/g.74656  ORF Transcript_47824/g.74656 Transcript_47824/m.74656 type:complete len:221 (-) Transcript_47824:528-1190(-)